MANADIRKDSRSPFVCRTRGHLLPIAGLLMVFGGIACSAPTDTSETDSTTSLAGKGCKHHQCSGASSSSAVSSSSSSSISGSGGGSATSSSASTGSGGSGGSTNPCSPMGGTTYYVSTAGSDGDPGTEAAPFRTIGFGASVLSPGDALCVRGGTYAEWLDDGIPGGSSWTAPITVAAYPGEAVVLRPDSGAGWVFHFASDKSQYIVLDGLVMDAQNVAYDAVKITWGSGGAAHHIRIKNSEVMNSPGQGILVTSDWSSVYIVDHNEFSNLKVHDNGSTDFDHGFYIAASYNLVDGCDVYRNAGWGVHVYEGTANMASYNVVRNSRLHDNARVGNRGPGLVLSSGVGNLAYNNVVWGNNGGIQIDYAVSDAKVYDNTVYANVANGGWWGILNGSESTNASIINNVVYANGASAIENYGSGATLTTNFLSDPRFIDAAGYDFHLQSSSGAIDSGTTLADVPNDADGHPRPQGAAYDCGAYEYAP